MKETLALTEKWSDSSKATITTVYNGFLNFLGLKWTKPKYKQQIKLPFIPTEQEIDSLIAASGKKLSTLLQLLKETGCRVGEATRIKWTDLNERAQTITVNSPEKNSLPGIFKISPKLMAMLNALPRKSEKIFHKANPNSMYLCLSRARRKLTNSNNQ